VSVEPKSCKLQTSFRQRWTDGEPLFRGVKTLATLGDPGLKPWFHVKIELFLKNVIPEPPPSVDRPNFFYFRRSSIMK